MFSRNDTSTQGSEPPTPPQIHSVEPKERGALKRSHVFFLLVSSPQTSQRVSHRELQAPMFCCFPAQGGSPSRLARGSPYGLPSLYISSHLLEVISQGAQTSPQTLRGRVGDGQAARLGALLREETGAIHQRTSHPPPTPGFQYWEPPS